jgi:hypothetical protein
MEIDQKHTNKYAPNTVFEPKISKHGKGANLKGFFRKFNVDRISIEA